MGLQLTGFAYDINPKEYLFQADGDSGKCFFIINECKLGGKNKDIYIIGDAFLKHFYSAFDFDNNQVSLGINKHSEGKVAIRKID